MLHVSTVAIRLSSRPALVGSVGRTGSGERGTIALAALVCTTGAAGAVGRIDCACERPGGE
ncbi:MAG: hypothetical protein ACT4QC_01750 [Planctomycetaceae bacterium]